jgi:hypothetical protein
VTRVGEYSAGLADIQGAWCREGRVIVPGEWEEVADVIWLQSGRHFCDLRVGYPQAGSAHVLDLPRAFSGTVAIEDGNISFHHDLDSLTFDPSHPDQGTVHRSGKVLIERGPGFEERWVAASPHDAASLVAEYRPSVDSAVESQLAARLVRVGAMVLVVWGENAPGGAHYDLSGDPVLVRSLQKSAGPVPHGDAVRALEAGDPLPTGWSVVSSAVMT